MVGSRWVYKIKHATNVSVEKLKVCFVDRGLSCKEGIDYDDTFTLVARYSSIREIISIVAQMGYRISLDEHEYDLPQWRG